MRQFYCGGCGERLDEMWAGCHRCKAKAAEERGRMAAGIGPELADRPNKSAMPTPADSRDEQIRLLTELVAKLGDRLCACAEVLGRLAEKRNGAATVADGGARVSLSYCPRCNGRPGPYCGAAGVDCSGRPRYAVEESSP